jgi:hypothetical protein
LEGTRWSGEKKKRKVNLRRTIEIEETSDSENCRSSAQIFGHGQHVKKFQAAEGVPRQHHGGGNQFMEKDDDPEELARQMVDRFARMNCGSISDLSRRRSGSSVGGGRRSLEEAVRHKATGGGQFREEWEGMGFMCQDTYNIPSCLNAGIINRNNPSADLEL